MGWEKRKGNLYYYQKQRVGGRVVSQYVGAGEVAELISRMKALDRQRYEVERETWLREKTLLQEEEAQSRAFFAEVETVLRQVLEEIGYHRHKGQWRKRRETHQSVNGIR